MKKYLRVRYWENFNSNNEIIREHKITYLNILFDAEHSAYLEFGSLMIYRASFNYANECIHEFYNSALRGQIKSDEKIIIGDF